MPDSDSSRSPTKRWPWKTVRPVAGNAGQTSTGASRAERVDQRVDHRADVALRASKSKVEQYLK